MNSNSGFNNLSDKDKETMQSAMNSKEAQELKNAIARSGNNNDIEALKAAFAAGNMDKSKDIIQKLFADEKCLKALAQLEEKFLGK